MPNQNSPYRKPTTKNWDSNRGQLPSMATPRRPETPKKLGFLGFVFILGITGGLIWLGMLLIGVGPYAVEVSGTMTQTPSVTFSPSLTASPFLTPSLAPGDTNTSTLIPSVTLTPTVELLPFILFGEPETMSSALIRPQLDCDWLVIAGQVWDLQGEPVTTSVSVHLFGELDGYAIDQYRLPGTEKAYGESGYEFALQGLLVASEDLLYIQLVDANNLPLSHPYLIQTYDDCQMNLILVNFKQVR